MQTKTEIRAAIRQQRQKISTDQARQAAAQVANYLVQSELFQSSEKIACYLSYASELPTDKIIQTILQHQKKCYVPVIKDSTEMQFAIYTEHSDITANQYGIAEPVDSSNKVDIQQLDLVIVPMLAFDLSGTRLGAGKGYYDRAFAIKNKPFLLGLAYAVQEVDVLPTDRWDVKLNGILTENGLKIFD